MNDQVNDEQQTYHSLVQLIHLNDDCLMEIFLKKSVDGGDLCAIADTCKRFKDLLLRRAPKNIILSNCDGTTFSTPLPKMQRFFELFGSRAEWILIEFDSVSDRNYAGRLIQQSWKFIRKYRKAKSPALVFCVRMNGLLVLKIDPSMMWMWMCDARYYGDDNALFMDCISLNRLDVTNVFDDSEILKHFYPTLEYFTHEKTSADYKSMLAVNEFILRHSTLKSISLWTPEIEFSGRGGVVRRNLLHAIGKSCTFLEELKMNVGQTDEMGDLEAHMNVANEFHFDAEIRPLRNLTSLRRLTLTNIHDSFECFEPLTQLHELTLYNCLLPLDSNEFRFLRHLRSLRIMSRFRINPNLTMHYMIGMVRELPKLKYLKIFNESFELDFSTYHSIVEIVKNRTRKLTLECEKQDDLEPTDNSLKHVELV